MDSKTITKNATAVFNALKAAVKERVEITKSHPYADREVGFFIDSEYDHKKGKYVDYIEVEGKRICEVEDTYNAQQISNEVIRMLKEQQKVRGWKYLIYNTKTITEGVNLWSLRKYTLLDNVVLCDAPCSEFKSLQSYLKKYANCTLPDFKLFSARMGGKRGVLWAIEGDRYYLANNPKECKMVLERIRKARGAKDSITYKFGEEDYIDPIDRAYSQRHEIECDGEKRVYVEITIKSPTGKVKYQEKIY